MRTLLSQKEPLDMPRISVNRDNDHSLEAKLLAQSCIPKSSIVEKDLVKIHRLICRCFLGVQPSHSYPHPSLPRYRPAKLNSSPTSSDTLD